MMQPLRTALVNGMLLGCPESPLARHADTTLNIMLMLNECSSLRWLAAIAWQSKWLTCEQRILLDQLATLSS